MNFFHFFFFIFNKLILLYELYIYKLHLFQYKTIILINSFILKDFILFRRNRNINKNVKIKTKKTFKKQLYNLKNYK